MQASAPTAPVLTPRQLAEAIGVSESSVKRWVDDGRIPATRTAGGHRRITVQEAARYVRENGVAVLRPDLLGLHDLAALEQPVAAPGDGGERLFRYLRTGAAAEARGLLLSEFLSGKSVAEVVDGPMAAAMARVGELWVGNPSGVFWEHRATRIAVEALAGLRRLLAPPADAPAAVGGAPTGDCYMLPSLAAAAVVEDEGLRATDLGPETPLKALELAAAEVEARLVWLSVSVASEVEKLRRGIERLVRRLASQNAVLVVGGAQAGKLSLAGSESLYVGRSMAELRALVQGMRLGSASAPVAG